MSGLTTAWAAAEMRRRGYEVLEGPPVMLTGGAADSRNVEPGQLFTAFRGENVDGNDYVAAAIERGAAAVICERAPGETGEATIIVVPDSVRAVGELAQSWLRHCKPRVIGITGTVGKTTAKEMIATALGGKFRVHKSPGNFNSLEGLPLALMSLWEEHQVAVLELAMDRPGEIRQLCELVEPEVGVVLNIGYTHASKLGSIEAIAEEKLSLPRWLPATGCAVLNCDDPRIAAARDGLACRVIGFSATGGSGEIQYSDVEDLGLDGCRFTVSHEGETVRVSSRLPGVHTLPAALAAIGAGMALGLHFRDAANLVSDAHPAGRMQVRRAKNGATILDDRYNASPASMAGALQMLAGRPAPRIALLGKMAELGDVEEAEHRRIGELAAGCCDVLAAEGEPCRALIEAAQAAGMAEARWFADKNEAARFVAQAMTPASTVLLKASRSQAFETLIPTLECAQ